MGNKKRNILYGAFISIILVILLFSLFHSIMGVTYPLLVVKSGSMKPLIEIGDIIIVTPVNPDDIKASPTDGDVIVFYRPGEYGVKDAIIVHRAIEKTDQGFITKGDANPVKDLWGPVPYKNIIGRWTNIKIPYWTGLGYLSLFLRGEYYYPLGPLLIALLIVANIILFIRDISASRRSEGGDTS